jgi:hypothetical protein
MRWALLPSSDSSGISGSYTPIEPFLGQAPNPNSLTQGSEQFYRHALSRNQINGVPHPFRVLCGRVGGEKPTGEPAQASNCATHSTVYSARRPTNPTREVKNNGGGQECPLYTGQSAGCN